MLPELEILPYSAMRAKLYRNDVITSDELEEIDALVGKNQMNKLYKIITTSLTAGIAAKYKGFLLAMEESEDILLQVIARNLGEWINSSFLNFCLYICKFCIYKIKYYATVSSFGNVRLTSLYINLRLVLKSTVHP